MKYIPYAPKDKTPFKMEVSTVDINENFKAPVFKVSVKKEVILHDLDKDLVEQEKKIVSVDEIDGPVIFVGSLDKVSDTGNWPTSYEINSGNKKK